MLILLIPRDSNADSADSSVRIPVEKNRHDIKIKENNSGTRTALLILESVSLVGP